MTKEYCINEMFYSLQGEGARAGEPSLFIRFAGCNMGCCVATHGFDCDTEFTIGNWLSADAIIEKLRGLSPLCNKIVCTGGEPLLQLDLPLCIALREADYRICLETNGTINPSDDVLDRLYWIACSPKAETILTRCNELRYVLCAGQPIPKPELSSEYRYLSPAYDGNNANKANLDWCVKLCLQNPSWKLSVQQHKSWEIK